MRRGNITDGLVFCLVLLVAGLTPIHSAQAALNVKDFGAKGDNKTDDTKAIQAAFEAAQKGSKLGETAKDLPGWGFFPTRPEIVFPAGMYRISSPIYISQGIIRGEGEAAIIQTQKDEDVFTTKGAWRLTVSGLTFVGGRNQLQLSNPNSGLGFVLIDQCRFYAADGVAIVLDEGTYSTLAMIRDCVFRGTRQALISYCDQTKMMDCYIDSSPKMSDMAVIESRGGRMLLENILGNPWVTSRDQRWIDNYGDLLVCRNFRFGGEGGGFTPIVNFAKYRPNNNKGGASPTIQMEGCQVYALGNNKRACAVYLEEIPNGISFRDNIMLVPAIKLRKTIDLKTYFKECAPGMLNFSLEKNNIGEFIGEFPALLQNPVILAAPTLRTPDLSEKETAKALAEATRNIRKTPNPVLSGPKASFEGHQQQTEPDKYVEIAYDPAKWRLDDLMDATHELNGTFLAMAPIGDDVVFLRRRAGGQAWPHILIKDVVVDLDETPFLTLRTRDDVGMPARFAFKAIDKESETMLMLVHKADYNGRYIAFDLREKFGVSGTRTFDLKFYYNDIVKWLDGTTSVMAKTGDYVVLDFIRFEQE